MAKRSSYDEVEGDPAMLHDEFKASEVLDTELEIVAGLCSVGLNEEAEVVMGWSSHNIDRLRQSLSAEQLMQAVESLEQGFSQFIGVLCGGRH